MEKQYILDEIRRTASANGGVPLGHQRFFKECGVKKADWYGKYWARWGDALVEAGFAPNQMNGAFDEEFLLGKFIELARELGRIPVEGDLLLKARTDPSYPSRNTFGRLGLKEQRIKNLLSFCQEREGYGDVVAMCRAAAPVVKAQAVATQDDGETLGVVYLLKSGRFHKIGRSNASGRRERELAIQLPEKAKIIHEIRTDDPPGIEAYRHKRFEEKRKNGEWFDLDAADVKAFRRRKFM